jgi:hypothetical protein
MPSCSCNPTIAFTNSGDMRHRVVFRGVSTWFTGSISFGVSYYGIRFQIEIYIITGSVSFGVSYYGIRFQIEIYIITGLVSFGVS